MLKSIKDEEKGSGLAIREGSMERWSSNQPSMAPNDSGIWRRGGSGGNRGRAQIWEAWGMSWESERDLHGRSA